MQKNFAQQEQIIEWHLKNFKYYEVLISNCQSELKHLTPTLTTKPDPFEYRTFDNYIPNDTELVAIEKLEGKKATALKYAIERHQLILDQIKLALTTLTNLEKAFVTMRYFKKDTIEEIASKLCFSEKSIYRLRKKVLDKLKISLGHLTLQTP